MGGFNNSSKNPAYFAANLYIWRPFHYRLPVGTGGSVSNTMIHKKKNKMNGMHASGIYLSHFCYMMWLKYNTSSLTKLT